MLLSFLITVGLNQALQELDAILLKENEITAKKEARIDSLRQSAQRAKGDLDLYATWDRLFDEYYKWNPDSAFAYAHRKMNLAGQIQDLDIKTDASVDLAFRYLISGLSFNALEAIGPVSGIETPSIDHVLYEIYHSLVQETVRDETLSRHFKELEGLYFQKSLQSLTPESIYYYSVHANRLILQEAYEEAIQLLEARLANTDPASPEAPILHYWLGRTFQNRGDEEEAMYHFALSAKADALLPNREHASLSRLAIYCYRQGDLQRACRYIVRSYSDAVAVDAKYKQAQIAHALPIIIRAYDTQETQSRRYLTGIVILLATFLFLLVLALLQLRIAIRRQREANRIKDTYLGEFLAIFAEHIGALERYRSSLRVAAKQNSFDVLLQELRSDKYIEAEWDFLMDRFDKTFLGLFPDFITQLNSLLRPDAQICGVSPNGNMSNQLRVYALIRLGILKSDRISKFLRLSSSTVYNFRVRLRNAARCKREDIELKLMKLGD